MTTIPDKTQTTVIECSCGMHLLKVQSIIEIFEQDIIMPVDESNMQPTGEGKTYFRQEYNMAMFGRGEYRRKPNLLKRIAIAFTYLCTGRMHLDQIVMTQEEAAKLATFITDNMQAGERQSQ